MANDLKLTFSTGSLSNLPSTFKAGQVLFAIDENNKGYIYFDKNSSTRVLMGSDSTYAEKANKDSNGNVIVSTYLTNLQGVKNTAETEYVIQGVRGDGSAPFNTSAVIPITLLSSANKTGTKLFLVGTTSQSSKGIIGYSNSNIYITTGNKLHANLEGKADTAGTADTANAIEWSKVTSKPQLVEGFDGSLENNGYKIQLYNTSGSPIPAATPAKNGVIVIPAASTTDAGLVTTGTQTFTGAKTFNTSISTPTLTVTGTGGLNYSGIQNGTTNVARVVWFADASYKGKPVYHTDFTYNPATGELKAGKFTSSGTMSGTALTLSLGDDSMHSTEDATLKVTGGASISERLSAKMIRIDNGVTDTAKGFNLIYNSTEECLEFQFGN